MFYALLIAMNVCFGIANFLDSKGFDSPLYTSVFNFCVASFILGVLLSRLRGEVNESK